MAQFNKTSKGRYHLAILVVPVSYALFVRGYQGYWLSNDLRHLYKEILKPYYKRVDDSLQSDYRDFKSELYSNKVDEKKSMVAKLRGNVEQKVIAAKYHIGDEKAIEEHFGTIIIDEVERSNLNMIKR
jgi:hypothetical protein